MAAFERDIPGQDRVEGQQPSTPHSFTATILAGSAFPEDHAGLDQRKIKAPENLCDWHHPRDLWLCCALLFLIEFGCSILGAPSPRLLEQAVCREYFKGSSKLPHDDPTEAECKQPEVQLRLSFLITVLSVASVVAATMTQIPMGILVDKKSRRLALHLNITSTILYWGSVGIIGSIPAFPVWSFFAAPAFILLGGGPWATGALVFAAISDTVAPRQRTTAFSIVEAIAGAADIVGPIVGAATMTPNPWMPFAISTGCFFLMFIPASIIEEKHSAMLADEEESTRNSEIRESEPLLGHEILTEQDSSSERQTRIIFEPNSIALAVCFLSFFLLYVARGSSNYIIPWVSVRFNETMAKAGLIFSLRAIISSLLYLLILPFANAWVARRFSIEPPPRDLIVSTISVALSSLGALTLAFAPNTASFASGFSIMVLGSGVIVTLRSYVASWVPKAFSGRLFTAISITEMIGGMAGLPIMGASYSWSITHEANRIGLHFVIAAASYLLIVLVLTTFQLTRWTNG